MTPIYRIFSLLFRKKQSMLYYKFYIVLQMMFFVMAVKVSLKYTFESCCSLHIDYLHYLSTYIWEISANQHASQFSVSSHVQFVLAFWLTFVLISQLHQKWWPGLDLLKPRINPMLHFTATRLAYPTRWSPGQKREVTFPYDTQLVSWVLQELSVTMMVDTSAQQKMLLELLQHL